MSRSVMLVLNFAAVAIAHFGFTARADEPASPKAAPQTRVAVYDDAGSVGKSFTDTIAALAERPDLKVERVKASDIRRGKLAGCAAVVFPGGFSRTQAATLGEDGRDVVKDFVRDGGGYVGLCAGAYLASSDYPWSLCIQNTKVLDKEHWARGFGKLDVLVTSSGRDALKVADERVTIYYHQGPLLAPAGKPDLPEYETMATFEGEMAKNGAPSGMMKGTTAVAASRYGKGRVLCFSPHPEMTDGLHDMLHRGVEWAIDAPTAKTAAPAAPATSAVKAAKPGVEIVGHRGASHDAPENTLAAINLAWEQGADAAEFDVYVSKDGHPVVIHDKTTKRVAGVNKAVAAQTLAELRSLDIGSWKDAKFAGARIPTLAEVLATVPAGKRAFVEIKCGTEGVPAILEAVKASGLKAEQVVIIGFSADVVAASKKARPELTACWIVDINPAKGKTAPTAEALIEKARAIKADGLDLSAGDALDKAYAATVKDAGLKLYVWTVDDPAVARRMAGLGVDGITTNRPGWLRERLK